MASRCRAAGMLPYCTPEEWERAYRRAALEMGLPLPGPRGSAENRTRRRRALQVADRARQLFWLDRASRRG